MRIDVPVDRRGHPELRKLRSRVHAAEQRRCDVRARQVRVLVPDRAHRLRRRLCRFDLGSEPLWELLDPMRVERSVLRGLLQRELQRRPRSVQWILRRFDEQSTLLRELHQYLPRTAGQRRELQWFYL